MAIKSMNMFKVQIRSSETAQQVVIWQLKSKVNSFNAYTAYWSNLKFVK